jgi:hypothetical protein
MRDACSAVTVKSRRYSEVAPLPSRLEPAPTGGQIGVDRDRFGELEVEGGHDLPHIEPTVADGQRTHGEEHP